MRNDNYNYIAPASLLVYHVLGTGVEVEVSRMGSLEERMRPTHNAHSNVFRLFSVRIVSDRLSARSWRSSNVDLKAWDKTKAHKMRKKYWCQMVKLR